MHSKSVSHVVIGEFQHHVILDHRQCSPFLFPNDSDGPVICEYDKSYCLSTLDQCQFWILYFPLLKSVWFFWGGGWIENFWRSLYWPRTPGNQPFLFHLWMMAGHKFPLNYVKSMWVLNITIRPKGLKQLLWRTGSFSRMLIVQL